MKINLGLALILTATLSCSRNDSPANGVQHCAAAGNTRCPAGYECVSDLCWLSGTAPAIDGGATDGMAIDGEITGGDGGSTCDPQTQNNVNGGCETKCTPTTTSCNPSGASVRLCSDTGSWADISICSAGCQNNACNDCSPGKPRCTGTNNGNSQPCGSDGKWAAVITTCTTGCTDGFCNECSGGPTCTNDGKLQACLDGKRGTPVACGDGKYCSAGACVSCPSVPAACTGVGSFCSSNPVAVVKCETNVTNKCLTLVSTANCQVPANGTATCASATCGTACNDPCTGGPRCGPSGGVQTCVAGTCPTWSAEQTCPADKGTCSNGVCVACVAGTTRPCSASGKKGTCAGGIETCNAGAWGACSVQPAAMDACVAGNDDNCDGTPSAGCTCDGFAMPNPPSSGLQNASSYDVSVPGVVTDKVTRLVWEAAVNPSRYTQSDASVYCGDKGEGWRLPTIVELYSLVDYTASFPSIDVSAFPATPQEDTWTSTTVAGPGMLSRFVNFEMGATVITTPSYFAFVRCVRGFSTAANLPAAKCYPSGSRYTASAAEVADGRTGLRWQRGVAPVAKTWVDAVAYCSTVGDGFRLPSVKELMTIVDFNKVAVKADPVFEGTTATGMWTSSPRAKNSSYAWLINFDNGLASNQAKTSSYQVRCVK